MVAQIQRFKPNTVSCMFFNYNIFQADIMVDQNYFWYASNVGDSNDSQTSGAYIFRPNDSSLAYPVSSSKVSNSIIQYSHVDQCT